MEIDVNLVQLQLDVYLVEDQDQLFIDKVQ